MCGCSDHETPSAQVMERDPDVLTLRVENMACGQCAATITKAVQAGIPGAAAEADSASKTVRVRGTTDAGAVRILIAAGYASVEASPA
jgi:copper chaperone